MFTSLWWLHEGQGIMLGIHLHGVSERDYRIHMLSWPCSSSQIHQVQLPFFLTIASQPASHDVSEQFLTIGELWVVL